MRHSPNYFGISFIISGILILDKTEANEAAVTMAMHKPFLIQSTAKPWPCTQPVRPTSLPPVQATESWDETPQLTTVSHTSKYTLKLHNCLYNNAVEGLLNYQTWIPIHSDLPSVLWRCWLGGRKGIRPVKNWVVWCWRGYLGWGADLHIAQQMPLPLTISCSSKSRLVLPFLGFTFLVPAHPGSPGQIPEEQ